MHAIMDDLRTAGRNPFFVAYGASDVTGALGYVNFTVELSRQLAELDLHPAALVHASGSSGTQAGTVVGAARFLPDLGIVGIDIDYERGQLTVQARVLPRQSAERTNYLLQEYGVGDFCRSFQVGEGIDAEKIHAGIADGVLTVHLPKAAELKPRRIEVKSAT